MRMGKLAGAVALVSTVVAVAAAPAGAGVSAAGSQASFCDPLSAADARVFSSAAGPSLLGRGGDAREPDLSQLHADMPASAKGKAPRNFKATIPVYFHVVTDGAIGALTNAQIAGQIAVLNNTFSAGEGGAATGFSFKLAGITRTDNAGWFYTNPGGADEHTMKQTLTQGGDNALNLYSTTAGDYLGWAYLPDITEKPGQRVPRRRGVRLGVDPGHLGHLRGPLRPGRDRHARGRPLAEPRAHVLRRLRAKGDFVEDTPAEKTPTSGCPAGKDTCTSRAWTRSTTTWTTPTTPATRSSRPARSSACATPGCCTARADARAAAPALAGAAAAPVGSRDEAARRRAHRLLAAGAAAPADAAPWKRVTTPDGSGIDQVGHVRTADGVLHLAWHHPTGPNTEDLLHTVISPGGAIGATTPIQSGWTGVHEPGARGRSGRACGRSGAASASTDSSDPQREISTALSADGGASWALQPGSVNPGGGQSYASPISATVRPDGSTLQAWSGTLGTWVHAGLSPDSPNYNYMEGLQYGNDPNLVTDAAGRS